MLAEPAQLPRGPLLTSSGHVCMCARADESLSRCEVCFQSHQMMPGVTYRGAWAIDIWTGHDRKWWWAAAARRCTRLVPLPPQGPGRCRA
jgi:hypothetical protein